MGYRSDIKYNIYDWEDVSENKHLEYVRKDEVVKIIDDIETRVNAILADLKSIAGLTEIEEIKCLVEELSKNIY